MVQKKKRYLPVFEKPSLQQVLIWKLPLVAVSLFIALALFAAVIFSLNQQPTQRIQFSPLGTDEASSLYITIIITLGGILVFLLFILVVVKIYLRNVASSMHAQQIQQAQQAARPAQPQQATVRPIHAVMQQQTQVRPVVKMSVSPALIQQARALIQQARNHGYTDSMIIQRFREKGWSDSELAPLMH